VEGLTTTESNFVENNSSADPQKMLNAMREPPFSFSKSSGHQEKGESQGNEDNYSDDFEKLEEEAEPKAESSKP